MTPARKGLLSASLLLFLVVWGVDQTKDAVLPLHLLSLTCAEMNSTDCRAKDVISAADGHLTWAVSTNGFASFAVVPGLTALMDGYGRRPVYALVAVGLCLDAVLCAILTDVRSVIIAHAACGVFGGIYVAIAASFTILSDVVSSSTERANDFGLVEASLETGVVLGPYIGGLIAKELGAAVSFYTAAAIFFSAFLYTLFIMDETLPASRRRRVRLAELLPWNFVLVLAKKRIYMLCAAYLFFNWLALRGSEFCISLFSKEQYGWSSYELGLLYSWAGVMGVISTGFITRLISGRWTNKEIVLVSSLVFGIGTLEFYLALHSWELLVLGMTVKGLVAFSTPTLRNMISSATLPDEQGATLGATGAIENLVQTTSPLIFGPLYKATSNSRLPTSLCFLAGTGMMAMNLLLGFSPWWQDEHSIELVDATDKESQSLLQSPDDVRPRRGHRAVRGGV